MCKERQRGQKEEVAQGLKIAECLRIIIRVIATVWSIRNQFCRIQFNCFTVESPGWPCTATFVDKEERFCFHETSIGKYNDHPYLIMK